MTVTYNNMTNYSDTTGYTTETDSDTVIAILL